MNKFSIFAIALFALIASACSNDPEAVYPQVNVSREMPVGEDAGSVTIWAVDALEFSYILSTTAQPVYTAEEVLEKGISARPAVPTVITINDVVYETPYYITVAAKSWTGETTVYATSFSIPKPEPKPVEPVEPAE